MGVVFVRVKWLGETEFLCLTHNREYEVLSEERGWYRIVDDSGEDYLYPPSNFEIAENGETILRDVLSDNFHAINFHYLGVHYTFSGWWLLEWDDGYKFYDTKDEFFHDPFFAGKTFSEITDNIVEVDIEFSY